MEQMTYEVQTERDFARAEMVYSFQIRVSFDEVTKEGAELQRLLRQFTDWWKTAPREVPGV